jgi:demethylmenaquinone methyltransferase/2-methoxy-6-polyprenyl-1,4-benzoquinol methylase
MFDGVAKRYDLVNDLLSLGRTKAWRKAATKIIAPVPGMVILDLAAGPGSSSEPLFKAGATVFATDFSEGMLAQGRKARPYLNFSKVVAEFSHPTWRPFRTIYTEYLMKLLPMIAKRTSSNPDAYVYLAESIRAWPDQAALAARMEKAGWTGVTWKNLTFGVVAVHSGIKG